MSAHLHPEVLRRLDTGSLLILPTTRSASELRRLFDVRQRVAQRPSWELANVQSWQQWTQSLWTNLVLNGSETRLLLNSVQEQSLWAEVIRLDQAHSSLDSPDALAALARSGFQRAAAHNATARLRATATTEDSRIFSEWAEAFTDLCKKRGCLSASLLESALARAVESGTLKLPPTLDLVSCNNLTPAQQTLLDALGEAETDILHLPLAQSREETSLSAVSLPTERDELIFVAQWIRSQLEAAASGGHTVRIALLVPDLFAEHTQIERTLRETLAPELHAVSEDLSSTPWEICTAAPLRTIPMIADALDLVRWAVDALPFSRVSALLLSPHLGMTADRDDAARFDAQTLRRAHLLRPEIDLAAMLRLPSKIDAPLWLRNLHSEVQRAGDLTRPRSYADWTEFFRGLTRAANWPGDRELTATESATVEAWEGALDTVATLDFSGQRVSLTVALTALTQQLEATTLQPPSTNAQLQVLTPADAEACLFDVLLYMRATDTNLPAQPAVHPLLSWPLQRSLTMPGTDPVLDATRARHALDALLANTPTALFTHARHDDSGKLRPSPLLTELQIAPLHLPSPSQTHTPITLETVPDSTPIAALPATIYGGTRVLKLQAACGFLAFAELRLRARELDQPELGFDALESGDIVHRVLHLLWKELGSRRALLVLSSDERRSLLNRLLDTVFQRHPGIGQWDAAYIAMHHQRTLHLLLRWLDREAERSDFTVTGTEVDQEITVGPLMLNVRVDRVDRVTLSPDRVTLDPARTGVLLVDYKTGASGVPADWDAPRPDDPQLPLYAMLAEPGELCGIAFAKLRAGKDMAWLGYQTEPGILPIKKDSTADLDEAVYEWRETLTLLAEDFAAGRASVDPKSYPKTCKHCAQRLLCRLNPATLRESDDSSTEDTDG